MSLDHELARGASSWVPSACGDTPSTTWYDERCADTLEGTPPPAILMIQDTVFPWLPPREKIDWAGERAHTPSGIGRTRPAEGQMAGVG